AAIEQPADRLGAAVDVAAEAIFLGQPGGLPVAHNRNNVVESEGLVRDLNRRGESGRWHVSSMAPPLGGAINIMSPFRPKVKGLFLAGIDPVGGRRSQPVCRAESNKCERFFLGRTETTRVPVVTLIAEATVCFFA